MALSKRDLPRLSIHDLGERLQGFKLGTGRKEGTATALCPSHGDRNPSLSIKVGDDGRILLCCRSGCTYLEIIAALGIEACQLFPATDAPWRPTVIRPNPDKLAADMLKSLQAPHMTHEQVRAEYVFVGLVLARGTAGFGLVADFDPRKLKIRRLRILWQAMQELAREGIPRRFFSPVALCRVIDATRSSRDSAASLGFPRQIRWAVKMARYLGNANRYERAAPQEVDHGAR